MFAQSQTRHPKNQKCQITADSCGGSLCGGTFGHVLAGTMGDIVMIGHEGADIIVVSHRHDTLKHILVSEGDVLNLDAILDGAVTSETLGDYVSFKCGPCM